ncbi:tryptophan synthase alpha chain [Gemmatimonas aurantiaca T-27]|uniref:Tryptophan synthase alpha chain n=1 Tax=Gemmatimonas aurantiaca (strain DSM 14586 / JCM 11422 / NBRC 100505 / T-27) TaxID=379066 RepID=C1A952_GEMAT|nr:tryptophan synthase subunit alpha [Gemmatimonas aurantiaca]BAH38762.1 tryptophan synthase alpha chain [Gemmatimonas aurantiaca T-27]
MASASATTSPDVSAPSRLTARFRALAAEGRKALVCYVTAGYPDPASSVQLLRGLAEAGADVIEVGVPFSDPMADGPVIQHSSQVALEHGITLSRTLDIVKEAGLDVPVVLFSYLNPILAGGDDVLRRARAAGVDGVLATDLPVGADPEREAWFGSSGLDFVRLVAPTTPAPRMAEIARHGGGFVYLISRLGVTGERDSLPDDLPVTVQRLRSATSLPLCIGFGISTPADAKAAAALGDGVVVGSALVRAAGRSIEDAIALTRSLRAALDER